MTDLCGYVPFGTIYESCGPCALPRGHRLIGSPHHPYVPFDGLRIDHLAEHYPLPELPRPAYRFLVSDPWGKAIEPEGFRAVNPGFSLHPYAEPVTVKRSDLLPEPVEARRPQFAWFSLWGAL